MFYHNHCTCSVVFYFEYRVLSGCFLDKMDRFFIHISKKWVKALYYLALTHFLATILSTMPKQKCGFEYAQTALIEMIYIKN